MEHKFPFLKNLAGCILPSSGLIPSGISNGNLGGNFAPGDFFAAGSWHYVIRCREDNPAFSLACFTGTATLTLSQDGSHPSYFHRQQGGPIFFLNPTKRSTHENHA